MSTCIYQGLLIYQDRKFAIQSSIMKIMKSKKTLHHNRLMSQAMEDLGRFKVEPKQIDKQIEKLLKLDYLELATGFSNSIDQSNGGKNEIYHYVP